MQYYIDIQLQPDAKMRENVLLNRVYSKLHNALCHLKTHDIGVSFPDYQQRLECLLRLHGTQQSLDRLQGLNWLAGLQNFCQISPITATPTPSHHRVLSRQQCNLTKAKLRRLIKRESIPAHEIQHYRAKMFQQGLTTPYVELNSHSSQQDYRLYIKFSEISDIAVIGKFNHFGLSRSATVPWF